MQSTREGSDLPVYTVKKKGGAKTYTSQGNPAFDVPVLAYGEKLRLLDGAVVCSSRFSGLKCRNRSGHGYFLSRDKQRRF